MKYKAVIFDLDGTLLDTIEDLSDSMNVSLEKMGFPGHTTESYKMFVGDGVRMLAQRALPQDACSSENIDLCLRFMDKEYNMRLFEKTRPYEGIENLLDGLCSKNVKIAVLSNKLNQFTGTIIAKLLPNWKFEVVFGERPGIPKKPDPSGAIEIAEIMGISPENILYLGDTSIDMKTANSAGMHSVGATWGFRSREELLSSGAKAIIDAPLELLDLL